MRRPDRRKNTRLRLAALVLTSCFGVAGAHAATSSASGAERDSPNLTQVDMTACAYQAFLKADRAHPLKLLKRMACGTYFCSSAAIVGSSRRSDVAANASSR